MKTCQNPVFSLLLLAALSAGAASASEPAPVTKAGKAARPAKAAPAAPPLPAAAPAAAGDSLDRLRERLAERLGAMPVAESANPNLVRAVSRSDAGPLPGPGLLKPAAKSAPASKPKPKADAGTAHWAYSGEVGPQAWGGLRPDFAKCGNGSRQSPIDIRAGIAVELQSVLFDYRASAFRVIDNGHTVQVNLASGNAVDLGGRRYELQQFHFHRPSEERVDGRQFDMSVHLVHKDGEGRLLVVAVLIDRGSVQPLVQAVWNNLPLEKHVEAPAQGAIDLNHLLPPDRGYYTYMGSLTTPPCSEGVQWVVMRQPVTASAEQMEIFSRLYPMNARPVQQAGGRLIKQSN
ncbi:MAG: carbonic anhydrase family protein [Rubrivivax sp.]|nr:carbonic anhydrase family protein [Rubrivivax sp.]